MFEGDLRNMLCESVDGRGSLIVLTTFLSVNIGGGAMLRKRSRDRSRRDAPEQFDDFESLHEKMNDVFT